MTDHVDFEARLESRLRLRASVAARPFDAAAIARQALAPVQRRGFTVGWGALPRSLRWGVVALGLALTLLGALAVGAALREQSVREGPVSNGWIIFANKGRERVSDSDIWIVRPGSPERALIGYAGDNVWQGCPTFSPDGSRIVFLRGPFGQGGGPGGGGGPGEVVLVSFDVSAGRVRDERVLDQHRGASCPRWSSDSQRVAYERASSLWVANVDGTVSEVFSWPDDGEWSSFDWSPDGTQIAVAIDEELWIIRLSGNGGPRVAYAAEAGTRVSRPRWSPDGTRIILGSTRYTAVEDGVQMDDLPSRIIFLDGGAAPIELEGEGFAWSPDGQRVAYLREALRYGIPWTPEIVTADRDGRDPVVLATDVASRGLIWSPDGRQVLYLPDYDGFLRTVAATGNAEPAAVTTRWYWFEYASDLDISWQSIRGATIDQVVPTPAATVSGAVHNWPGARGDEGPGLYHWDLEGGVWMHNVSEAYAGASLTFSRYVSWMAGAIDGVDGVDVSVAGHGATYWEVPADALGTRRMFWHVRDIVGGMVYITLEVPPETSDAALTEIRALVTSLRLEPATTPSGFRLVFESLGGWDSG